MAKAPQAKVHVMVDGRPLCGGGNGAKAWRAWQADMGPANCGACLAISAKRSAKAAANPSPLIPLPPGEGKALKKAAKEASK